VDRTAALERQFFLTLQKIAELEDKLLAMAEQNADLRRRLAENSDNSSQPP
jgi:predicted DNA-binding ribbon-helix-helix protein